MMARKALKAILHGHEGSDQMVMSMISLVMVLISLVMLWISLTRMNRGLDYINLSLPSFGSPFHQGPGVCYQLKIGSILSPCYILYTVNPQYNA